MMHLHGQIQLLIDGTEENDEESIATEIVGPAILWEFAWINCSMLQKCQVCKNYVRLYYI